MINLTEDLRTIIETATQALERGEVVRFHDVEVSVTDESAVYVRAERIANDGTRSPISWWRGANAHAFVLREALFAALREAP